MKLLKKSLALLLAMVVAVGAFSSLKAEAKEFKPKTPEIKSVKLSKDGTGIVITINKTNKDVEGYEVYISGVFDNSLYQNKKEVFRNEVSFEKKSAVIIQEPGTKQRTVTVKAENLRCEITGIENYKTIPSGKYTIKVRAYNWKKLGTTVWSEYSKAKKLEVSTTQTTGEGYKTKYDFSKVKKGDTITFGAYEQDANIKNGQEPIEWIVLSKTKSRLFVVSKYELDVLPYNLDYKDVTWETCTLRKWLNDNFYNAAFNKKEKALIKTVTVENYDNPEWNIPGGNDTKDKIFLLSQSEALDSDYGFSEDRNALDKNRRSAPTVYATARGAYWNSYSYTKDDEAAGDWWLRSPGLDTDMAGFVNYDGYVYTEGSQVSTVSYGVRPAIYVTVK